MPSFTTRFAPSLKLRPPLAFYSAAHEYAWQKTIAAKETADVVYKCMRISLFFTAVKTLLEIYSPVAAPTFLSPWISAFLVVLFVCLQLRWMRRAVRLEHWQTTMSELEAATTVAPGEAKPKWGAEQLLQQHQERRQQTTLAQF